jgi:hypothetical protein
MTAFTIYKSSLLLAARLFSSGVQASSCITAGRMDNSVWAPQFFGPSDQTKRAATENAKILGFKKHGF